MGTFGKVLIGIVLGVIIVWMAVPHSSQSSATSLTIQKTNDITQAIDYHSVTTINFARSHIQSSSSGEYNLAQVCDIWEYAYKSWDYINDPQGSDFYSPASNTISVGLKGDCDDYAILIAALVESIGGTSRVVTASDSDGNRHAFAEVYLGTSENEVNAARDYICHRYDCKNIWYYPDSDSSGTTRYWLNLDWWANHPGGPYNADVNRVPFYPADREYVPLPAPTVSPYPIQIYKETLKALPYGNIRWYQLDGNPGDIYDIRISSTDIVDILVLDQSNFNIYKTAFKNNDKVSFSTKKVVKSVFSQDFSIFFTESPYYLVIENANFLNNGANSQENAIVTVIVNQTGHIG